MPRMLRRIYGIHVYKKVLPPAVRPFSAAVRNGRTHRYGDRARTRTVRAGCNERLRSGTYNAEWRSSGGTIPSRIVEVPAARAATKTKKDLQEMQAFDYSWTQRGMIPRPSDYESAALTD